MPKYHFKFAKGDRGINYNEVTSDDKKTTVRISKDDLIISNGDRVTTLHLYTGGGENTVVPPAGGNYDINILNEALELLLGGGGWRFVTVATTSHSPSPMPSFTVMPEATPQLENYTNADVGFSEFSVLVGTVKGSGLVDHSS